MGRFKALEQLTEQLLYERAVAKKYNDNTTYKGGEGADKSESPSKQADRQAGRAGRQPGGQAGSQALSKYIVSQLQEASWQPDLWRQVW